MSTSLFDRTIIQFVHDIKRNVPFETGQELDFIMSLPVLDRIAALKVRVANKFQPVLRYSMWAQLLAFYSKFQGNATHTTLISDDDRKRAAFDKFQAANKKAAEMNHYFAEEFHYLGNDVFATVINEASVVLYNWFDRCGLAEGPTLSDINDGLRPGPGSSLGTVWEDFYHKVGTSPLTATSPSIMKLWRICSTFSKLAYETERNRFTVHGHHDNYQTDSLFGTVPKNFEIDRMICTEASLNMMFQKSLANQLNVVLSSIDLDPTKQPDINRSLAMLGSLYGTYCTIDLVSASDTICVELVRRLFVYLGRWMEWFELLRSDYMVVPFMGNFRMKLECMSTMGNGFTFPLQTLIFAALVQAVHNVSGNPDSNKNGKSYAVFGDDIIVRNHMYNLTKGVLNKCGFTVNEKKSFHTGHFRESCGHDWLDGYPVRPVYCENISTVQERISLINRLIRWSTYTGIQIQSTIAHLINTIPKEERYLVPPWENDDSGIHMPGTIALEHKRITCLQSRHIREIVGAVNPGSVIYKCYEVIPTRILLVDKVPTIKSVWTFYGHSLTPNVSYWSCKPQKGVTDRLKAMVNEPAAMLSFLGGYLRDGAIGIRSMTIRYKSDVFGIAPGWSAPIDSARFNGWNGTSVAWEATASLYLSSIK